MQRTIQGRALLFIIVIWFILKSILPLVLVGLFAHDSDEFRVFGRQRAVEGFHPFAAQMFTWDALHYLEIARHGYAEGDAGCAFYPLWPASIRLLLHSFGPGYAPWAVWLTNGLVGGIAAAGLASLVSRRTSPGAARDAVILLAAAPGAVFLSVPYSESLCLLLVVGLFIGLQDNRALLAIVTSMVLPLVRPIGIFCLPVLLLRGFTERGTPWIRLAWLAPLFGYALYFVLMGLWAGDPLAGFKAQRYYPNHPSIANALDFQGVLQAFLHMRSILGMLDGWLDRFLFVLILLTLPAIWRLDREWFLWSALVGVVPALTNWFLSYRRFMLMAFPVFVIWALWFQRPDRRWLFYVVCGVCIAIQCVLLARYASFQWAG